MVSDPEAIEHCLDKRKFVDFCLEKGFPVPKTYRSLEEIGMDGFPVFAKPIRGSSGQGCRAVSWGERATLDFGLELVQERITCSEFTVDYLADWEGRYLESVVRHRIEVVDGESTVTQVRQIPAIQSLCRRLGEALGLIGHNNIQLFYRKTRTDHEGEIRLIEVNPRFGGASNLAIQAGLDSPQILLRLFLGQSCDAPVITDGLKMMRAPMDYFFPETEREIEAAPRVYCVDIDGTICTEGCPYEKARPIERAVRQVNRLYETGHRVVLCTARGSKSGVDYRPLLVEQLSEWGVKYHELHTGKPYGDYYVDNKAVDVLDWGGT
jgi:carbamoyl-phosphate synthase large subunit